MGTRGLKIVRFRGRFYVYYNHYDSYPEHLGQEIVDNIPSDPEEYKIWLETQRRYYAQVHDELEDQVFVISDAKIVDCVEALYQDVEQIPCFLRFNIEWDIEWTYTLDLDHEIFSVMDSAHFRMDNIPRNLWIKALKFNDRNQLTVATDVCPPNTTACPALISQHHDPEVLAAYVEKYWELDPSLVTAKLRLDPDTQKDFQSRCFRTLVYTIFCDAFMSDMRDYSLTWIPDDFIFREMAFAMLSLASGQVCFETFELGSEDLHTDWNVANLRQSTYVTVGEGRGVGGSKVVPQFATGSHRPGELPGSAPTETAYWFEDVLVSLTTGLDKPESCQMAIAKTVEFGLECAADFQAVIVDLLFCVLVDVYNENGKPAVRHTRPISLFPINPSQHTSTDPAQRPGNRDIEEDDDDERTQQNTTGVETVALEGGTDNTTGVTNPGEIDDFTPILSRPSQDPFGSLTEFIAHCPGFVALMEFFNVAVARRFERRPPTKGVLPAELYAYALEYADARTHRVCSTISPPFRAQSMRHFKIDDTFVLDKVHFRPRHHAVIDVVDTVAGTEAKLGIDRKANELSVMGKPSTKQVWIPVVGSERLSILSQVKVTYYPVIKMLAKKDTGYEDSDAEDDWESDEESDGDDGEDDEYYEESEEESDDQSDDQSEQESDLAHRDDYQL